jgi:hypothetical protein
MCVYIYIYTRFCKYEICNCNYASSGYHGNELSSVNTLYERKLNSASRTSDHAFVFVYRVIFVKIDNMLMWICEV